MKKRLLALGMGALLLAGSAATASAASQIDFSGYYRTYFSNLWNNTYKTSEARTSDSGFFNRLNMDFGFHPTDEVSVYWRLRAPKSQRWGDQTTGADNIYYYGEVKQDWGKVSIGRLAAKFYYTGLGNLGWQPMGADGSAIITLMNPFNISDDEHDGLRYANRWDNFQLVAQFSRLGAVQTWGDAALPPPNTNTANGDWDSNDLYLLEGAYFWDGGGASLGLHYLRDRTRTRNVSAVPVSDIPALKAFYLNPAVSHRWDNGFGLHFEGKAGWGTDDWAKAGGPGTPTGKEKRSGYGFYLDLDYNYGPGNVNLAGWWTSGDDNSDPDKQKDFVGMGRNFKPLLIAYGNTASFQAAGVKGGAVRTANNNKLAGFGNGDVGNHWAIDLNGNHKLTKDLTMTYALAYLSLTKAAKPEQKKDIGWEADLSFQIQLLDNLKLGTSFGYFAPGDALKEGDDSAAATYAWFNTLTFSF